MNQEDLKSKLKSMRSGASLDISCRSMDTTKKDELELWQTWEIIGQFCKILDAYTLSETITELNKICDNLGYCNTGKECNRGTKLEDLKEGLCPQCQERLNE